MGRSRFALTALSVILISGSLISAASGALAKPNTTPNSPLVTVSASPSSVTNDDETTTFTITVNRQSKAVSSCTVTGATSVSAATCGDLVSGDKYSTTYRMAVQGSPWVDGANAVTINVNLTSGGSGSGSTVVTATLGDAWSSYIGCYAGLFDNGGFYYTGPMDSYHNVAWYVTSATCAPGAEPAYPAYTWVQATSLDEASTKCSALGPSLPPALVSGVVSGFPASDAWACNY